MFPKKHAKEVSIDQINIKDQHPMVDSSISQVHQSSHGNRFQTSDSSCKGTCSHNVLSSLPSCGKQLFVFPKQQDDETRNNKVTIKWQHPMVDSSISQIFHSSHGNHGENSNSLGKGIDSGNAHPSLAYLGKQFLYFQSSMLRNLIMLKLVSKTNRLWHTLARP